MIQYITLFILCTVLTVSTQAQSGKRYTQQEIESQDAVMDALVDLTMERYDLAIPKLTKLYREDRTSALISYHLAKAYAATEDFANAEKYAIIAARNDQENSDVQRFYAQLMAELEKYEEAAKGFQRLVILEPYDFSHIENYAKATISNGKPDLALRTIDQWESKYEVLEPLIKLKYDLYLERNENDLAAAELRKLVAHYPGQTRYLNNLAIHYLETGDKKEARKIFEAVLEIDPDNSRANTSMVALVSGDKKDAPFLRSLMPLIEKVDIDPNVKIAEILPYVNEMAVNPDSETLSSLISISESLTLIHPDHPQSQALYADVLNLSGEDDKAILAYEKTLTLDKRVYQVWEQLLFLLYNNSKYDKLSQVSLDAIDYFPNQAKLFFFYGFAMTAKNNPDEAIDYLNEGLMIAAKNTSAKSDINAALARAYLLKNDVPKALLNADKALALSEDKNPFALEVMGDIKAFSGKQEEAQKYWLKAQSLGSESSTLLEKLNQ